jgi:G2/mitotic-specific cyclin 3/4
LNPLRRAAFADVSNTRNTTLHEDGTSKSKNIALELKHFGIVQKESVVVKPVQTSDINTSRPQNLIRPLQRPQTAAVHKALPAAPVNSEVVATKSTSSLQAAKPQSSGTSATSFSEISSLIDFAPIRKTIIKRHTTIFRETSIGSTAPPPLQVLAPVPTPSETSTQISQTSQDLSISIVQPTQTVSVVVVEDVKEPASSIVEPEFYAIVPSNLTVPLANPVLPAAPIDVAPTNVASLASVPKISASREYLEYVAEEPEQPVLEPELYLPALETQSPTFENTILDEKVVQPQVITDLEEYWEEEAEEEFFDAEGCVTARSLRSMGGENTTSGMSTVMMPRVTSRVERELAAAKAWVDETGFSEITEDEAWDTTMVTEYGDEIFDYMRELEVCLLLF